MEPNHYDRPSETTYDLSEVSFSPGEQDNRRAREVNIDYDFFEFDEATLARFIQPPNLGVIKERREQIVQSFRQLKGKDLPKIGIVAECLKCYVEDWSLGQRQLREIQSIALDSIVSFNSLNPQAEWAILEWHRIYCYAHSVLNFHPPYRNREGGTR